MSGKSSSVWLPVLAALAVFGFAFFVTASVWNECRAEDHSFFYCLRLVSR